jgi:hypothetical protein
MTYPDTTKTQPLKKHIFKPATTSKYLDSPLVDSPEKNICIWVGFHREYQRRKLLNGPACGNLFIECREIQLHFTVWTRLIPKLISVTHTRTMAMWLDHIIHIEVPDVDVGVSGAWQRVAEKMGWRLDAVC